VLPFPKFHIRHLAQDTPQNYLKMAMPPRVSPSSSHDPHDNSLDNLLKLGDLDPSHLVQLSSGTRADSKTYLSAASHPPSTKTPESTKGYYRDSDYRVSSGSKYRDSKKEINPDSDRKQKGYYLSRMTGNTDEDLYRGDYFGEDLFTEIRRTSGEHQAQPSDNMGTNYNSRSSNRPGSSNSSTNVVGATGTFTSTQQVQVVRTISQSNGTQKVTQTKTQSATQSTSRVPPSVSSQLFRKSAAAGFDAKKLDAFDQYREIMKANIDDDAQGSERKSASNRKEKALKQLDRMETKVGRMH
jgi:hypothetical protein